MSSFFLPPPPRLSWPNGTEEREGDVLLGIISIFEWGGRTEVGKRG